MGAGRGAKSRTSPMRAAKRQALSGSAPGAVVAGGAAAGAAGVSGQQQSSSQGQGKGYNTVWGASSRGSTSPYGTSPKVRAKRRIGTAKYGAAKYGPLPVADEHGEEWYKKLLGETDEAVPFANIMEADQHLKLNFKNDETLVTDGVPTLLRVASSVSRQLGDERLKFGGFVLLGMAKVKGARRIDEDWVVTIFEDNIWTAANSKTNKIGGSCGEVPCQHRVAALVNAKANSEPVEMSKSLGEIGDFCAPGARPPLRPRSRARRRP